MITEKSKIIRDCWICESNETSVLMKDYSGRIVDESFLEKLQTNMKNLKEGDGIYKFYFIHIQDGMIVDKIKMPIFYDTINDSDSTELFAQFRENLCFPYDNSNSTPYTSLQLNFLCSSNNPLERKLAAFFGDEKHLELLKDDTDIQVRLAVLERGYDIPYFLSDSSLYIREKAFSRVKINKDNFIWEVIDREKAKELSQREDIELYKLYNDDSEAAIENKNDLFGAFEKGTKIGVEIGFKLIPIIMASFSGMNMVCNLLPDSKREYYISSNGGKTSVNTPVDLLFQKRAELNNLLKGKRVSLYDEHSDKEITCIMNILAGRAKISPCEVEKHSLSSNEITL